MRTMYDAVTVSNLPVGGDLYAGYDDGLYANVGAIHARFPGSLVLAITVIASDLYGDVLDVETGDATPVQAPQWVAARRAGGHPNPIVYTNSSTWPTVKAAFSSAGIAPPIYWIAQYDNAASIPVDWLTAGCVAKQYKGGDTSPYDTSVVINYIPGIDQESPDMPAPNDVVDELHGPNGSVWQLKASGEVDTKAGTAFYGSYWSLPPVDRQGTRYFTRILPRPDGRPGYRLVANDGSDYDFPLA